jgi:hypothetical protein
MPFAQQRNLATMRVDSALEPGEASCQLKAQLATLVDVIGG